MLQIRASIKQLLTKYQIFTILPQISHFHKYRNFSSIFATLEKVYFRSQILERPSIGEYWNIAGVPVVPENVIFTLERAGLIQKLKILERKNFLVLSNTHVVSGTWSILFPQLFRQTAHPYKFYGRDMLGILFFIFASCEPLRFTLNISHVHVGQYKKKCKD